MTFGDPDAAVPAELETREFVLRPITAADAELDHAAVMETRDDLRVWQQSTWPADDFTVEANRDDLVGLENRHRDHRAFTYTVLSPDGARCLGCVYLFPVDATFLTRATVAPLGEDRWADVDAVVYFWVRRSEMETQLDERLLAALRCWFDEVWKFARTVFVTNEQFARQVGVLERSDLQVKFELVEPGKPGRYLVFG